MKQNQQSKTQQKPKRKMMKLTSNLSSVDLEQQVQMHNIHEDVVRLIDKYAGDKSNTSVYTDKLDNKEGFFLMWVKKNLNLPLEEQIQIYTLARLINFDDVVKSMEKTISDMVVEQKTPKNFA